MDRPGLPAGWTLAVAGGKGGCGKTTTALGLARALATRGRRPVAVDGDVDLPDLHLRAGVEREPGLPAIAAGQPPTGVCQPSQSTPGVEVVPAGTGRPLLDRALAPVAALDRPTLIDSPAGAGPAVAAALRVADATVLVATDAPASLEDAGKTAEMAGALDAPPVATVVRSGTDQLSDPAVAGTPVRVVPDVSTSPLGDERVRAAHERVVALLSEASAAPG